VLVRPSYVLGGRAMVIATTRDGRALHEGSVEYSQDRPVLIDHFLEDAIEVDVTRSRRRRCGDCGIMQHIEEAAYIPATLHACCQR